METSKPSALTPFFALTDHDTIIFRGDYMTEDGDDFIKNGKIKMTDDNQRQNYSLAWKHSGKRLESELMIYTSIYDKDFEARNNRSDKLTLTGAIRYNDSDHFENETSPKIGLVYRVIEHSDGGLRFKANYGHGFKTPTPADRYKQNVRHDKKMVMLPNENIGPESSNSFDLSVEGDFMNFSGKISYFQNDVEDLIDNVFTGKIAFFDNPLTNLNKELR